MTEIETKKCIGCGYCCKKAMCSMGVFLIGKNEIECPLLIWNESDKRYYCKAALQNQTYAKAINVGEGCCSPLNTWRNNVKKRNKK